MREKFPYIVYSHKCKEYVLVVARCYEFYRANGNVLLLAYKLSNPDYPLFVEFP